MKMSPRINIFLTDKEKIELKVLCVLTKCSMSHFIRIAIIDKIKQVKSQEKK